MDSAFQAMRDWWVSSPTTPNVINSPSTALVEHDEQEVMAEAPSFVWQAQDPHNSNLTGNHHPMTLRQTQARSSDTHSPASSFRLDQQRQNNNNLASNRRPISHASQEYLSNAEGRARKLEDKLTLANTLRESLETEVSRLRTVSDRYREDSQRWREVAIKQAKNAEIARTRVVARDAEIEMLERSVNEMKRSIALQAPKSNGTTDEVLRMQYLTIMNQLENWIVSNFCIPDQVPIMVESILGDRPNEWVMNADRKPRSEMLFWLCQNWTSNKFMKIFNHFYFGLRDDFVEYLEIVQYAGQGTAAETNDWRVKTIGRLNGHDSTAETAAEVGELAEIIDNCLSQILLAESNPGRVQELTEIIDTAVKFNRLCREQTAKYRFDMPRCNEEVRAYFRDNWMEDIEGRKAEAISGKLVKFCTMPAMTKVMEVSGDIDFNFIVKAKVCVELN